MREAIDGEKGRGKESREGNVLFAHHGLLLA
jgi:hypothetical protein